MSCSFSRVSFIVSLKVKGVHAMPPFIERLTFLVLEMIEASGGNVSDRERECIQEAGGASFEYLRARFPAEWVYACAKLRGESCSKKIVGPVAVQDIGAALEEEKRVTLLMRHAERPPLDPSDTTFGETLPITEQGHRDAVSLGKMLAGVVVPGDVAVYAKRSVPSRWHVTLKKAWAEFLPYA